MARERVCGQSRGVCTRNLSWRSLAKPLLAHALERAALIADEALIVTNQDHYFLTENLLKETPKAPKVSYLLEPRGRNTAPAIALAVRHIQMVMAMKPCVSSSPPII